MSISLTLIVKNEGQKLARCLSSVCNYVDEMVIVDTGSKDNTKEIAAKFNSKIYDFNWINDFSAARNFALSKSRSDWILYLDADEWLDDDSIEELTKIRNSKVFKGVNCRILNYGNGSDDIVEMHYPRIFPNDSKIKFEGKVHEQIESSLIKNSICIINSNIVIHHDGYLASKEILEKKSLRNLEILLNEFDENHSSYSAFQIANSYKILENEKKSLQFFKQAYSSPDLSIEHKMISLYSLIENELNNSNFENALQLINEALQLDDSDPMIHLYNSVAALKTENMEAANKSVLNAFNLRGKTCVPKTISIKLNIRKIIYQGLLIGKYSGNTNTFNYFLSALNGIPNAKESDELKFISRILHNENFSSTGDVIDFIDEISLEFYLDLLEGFAHKHISIELLELLSAKLNSPDIPLQLGLHYLNLGDLERAEKNFTIVYGSKSANPAVVFYLASIYSRLSQSDKLAELITSAKEKYKCNRQVSLKIKQLEEMTKAKTLV